MSARQEQDGQGLGWTSVSKAGTGWTRPWLDKCQQGKSRIDKALVGQVSAKQDKSWIDKLDRQGLGRTSECQQGKSRMDKALVGQVSARQEQDGQGLGCSSVSKARAGWTRPWCWYDKQVSARQKYNGQRVSTTAKREKNVFIPTHFSLIE